MANNGKGIRVPVADHDETPVPYIGTDAMDVRIPLAIWDTFVLRLIAEAKRPPEKAVEISKATVRVGNALVKYRQGQQVYSRSFRIDASVQLVDDDAAIGGGGSVFIPREARSPDNLRAIIDFSTASIDKP